MEKLALTPEVERLLRASMLDQRDLAAGIRQEQLVEVPGKAGHYRCLCTVAVRRPLDPETAQLRRLELSLRRSGETLEVYAVGGLDPELEELAPG